MLAARGDLRTAELVACVLLGVAMIFGGGSRGLGDAVVGLAALPAAIAVCIQWRWSRLSAAGRATAVILLAAIAWHCVQLIPGPAKWFALGPMRVGVLADLRAAGAPITWRPMALDVVGTIRSLQSLVVFSSLLGLLVFLRSASRLRLIKVAVAIGCAMASLGYAQAGAGALSSLRPYDYHHPIGAIGVFANRNHFACLMAMCVPLSLALAAQAGKGAPVAKLVWNVISVMLLLAAGLSFSRTGFLLACASALVGLTCLMRRQSRAVVTGSLVALGAIGLVSVYAWQGLLARLEQDPLQDLRWQYLNFGWEAAKAYFPLGSGPGSFPYVYAPFEPIAKMREVYIVVVDTDDTVLVAHKDHVQDVKAIVSDLKAAGRSEPTWHRKVYRPWGSYDSIDMGERFQVKRITVKPGASLSLQMHHHRAEHWIVVSGTGRITRGDEVVLLGENQSTYIPLGVTHRLENPGRVPLELIEVQSGSYLGEDDIVRFEDVYGRG